MKSKYEINDVDEVIIINFGCKLNQFEGEILKDEIENRGIKTRIVHPSSINEHFDGKRIFIINTCTVTAKSDRKSRNAIYRAVKIKKDEDLVIVTGCYAQTDREEIEKIRGVDIVLDNIRKAGIPDLIFEGKLTEKRELFSSINYTNPGDRARFFVKVQDGCNMGCTYCKIPLARGRSRSFDYNDIVSYIKRLENIGYNEVVLTGINLGSYRFNGIKLSDLLWKILDATSYIRIRLSSIEPMYFNADLFEVITEKRIVPHIHLPLQSGSDKILRLMRRPYTSEKFYSIANKLLKSKKDLHLATDVIVGFPDENEDDFERTYSLIKEIGFSSLHVFKYSPRKGTEAYSMIDNVPENVKAERSERLIKLSHILNYEFRKRYLGKIREVILEEHGDSYLGVTDNYIKVYINGEINKNMKGKVGTVKITEVNVSSTRGVLINDVSP